MPSDIELWMRRIEDTLREHDRRIRSKDSAGSAGGSNPIGPAGGDLTGSYPNPSIGVGKVTTSHVLDGTLVAGDMNPANVDGAANVASLRTLGTGAQQAAAGNDARLSNARTPLAHNHAAADVNSGTFDIARIPTGTTGTTVALGNHTHNLSAIVSGGTMNAPLVMVGRTTTPGSIPTGSTALYFKADGYAYTVDDSGVEKPLIPKPDQLHLNASLDATQATTSGGGSSTVVSHLAPDQWSWFWTTSGMYFESDETTTLYGLGKSAKIVMSSASQGLLASSIFAVSEGSIITVSGWVRGVAGSGATGTPRALITLYTSTPGSVPDFFQPAGTVSGVDTSLVSTSGTWQKITASFSVPTGHTKARFFLRSDSGGGAGTQYGTVWWDESESSMIVSPPAQVITGEIKMWPTATAPAGYLLCDGSTFDSGTYPALASLLGSTYGTASGTTYFLPDFRGRSPVGVGTVTPAQTGGSTFTLGQKYGTSKHTLSLTEIPNVTGTITPHSGEGGSNLWSPTGVFSGSPVVTGAYRPGTAAIASASSVSRLDFSLGGGGGSHENTSPVLGINFIIKT